MGKDAEGFGSPRARTQRKIDETAKFFIEKGSGGNVNLPGEHPMGKNPGDVMQERPDRFVRPDSLARPSKFWQPEEGRGKNPGDVIRLSPKYEQPGGHSNRQGLNRELDIVTLKAYREYQKPIAEYLKNHILSKHKPLLDECFGEHKWRHWIRTDLSGASLPGVDDWQRLKEILGFDDTFDDNIYEIEKLNIPIFQSGSNPGDFWTITTQPFKDAHFAVFPEALCRTPIMAGCPLEVCVVCGKPRERISEKGDIIEKRKPEKGMLADLKNDKFIGNAGLRDGLELRENITMGWSDCGCGKGFKPGIVLDPFAGSGTVGIVARKLLRDYILIDLKQDYVEMARKRLSKIPERLDRWE